MTSTTERYPIKAKSLTLLELCQSIHDFRNPSSRNTAQILTRRLYLHPLTINPTGKLQSSKMTTEADLHADANKSPSSKRRTQRDLTVHSSSVPLLTRFTTKTNTSVTIDEESSQEFENSQTTFSTNRISLPAVPKRKKAPPKQKRSVSTRPSTMFQPKKIKPLRPKPEKVNVWEELAQTLQRPIPEDPPTTPFNDVSEIYFEPLDYDLHSEDEYQSMYNSIQEIKIMKRTQRPDQP